MSISDLAERHICGFGFPAKSRKVPGLYAALSAIGVAVLAAPAVLVMTLTAALDLPQPLLFPLAVGIIVVDLYLAARLSLLFSHAIATDRLPPLRMWGLSGGMVGKLAVTLLLAPWPFDIAFKLVDGFSEKLSVFFQMPIFLLATVLSLAGIAVMFSILAEAYRLCAQRVNA